MLTELTLSGFAAELATDSPAPGGGSVAAAAGGMAAGLVAMVCRLSLGRAGLEDRQAGLEEALARVEELRARLMTAVDRDTDAYLDVVAAYRLPKQTDDEKAARSAQIQVAVRNAADVPLATAEECLEVLRIIETVCGGFNSAAASDLGVAAQMAATGVAGGVLNVEINVPSLKDQAARDALLARAAEITAEKAGIMERVWPAVQELARGG
jgi:formiminotetrahydrofolate cyclodeaminase